MSDPIGTVGLKQARDPALDDLALAYKGGPSFADRIAALSEAKDAHDSAFAKLQLGNDVVVARAQAQKALENARDAEAVAQRGFLQSKADAEAVVKDAQARANAILAEAQQTADEIGAKARQLKFNADRYLAKTKGEADELKANAAALNEQATQRVRDAETQMRSHVVLASEMEAARNLHEENARKLQAKLDRLNSVMTDLRG